MGSILRISVFFPAFLCRLQLISSQSVTLDVSYIDSPLISSAGGVYVFKNTNMRLNLLCSANYPVEWFGNYDSYNPSAPTGVGILSYSTRKFSSTIDEPAYNYGAVLEIYYFHQLVIPETHVCRAVANHGDNIAVKFEPDDQGQIAIRRYPGAGAGPTEASPIGDKLQDADDACPLTFEIQQLGGEYHWHCKPTNAMATATTAVEYRECSHLVSAIFCANELRELKARPTCVKIIHGGKSTADSSWTVLPARPGVAVCSSTTQNEAGGEPVVVTRAAVEYFFEGKQPGGKSARQIRFSQADVDMKNLIWLDPVPTGAYYAPDKLKTRCRVPKYGFAFDPVLILTMNGSRFHQDRGYHEIIEEGEKILSKDVTINFAERGPGLYEIHCVAPVWNTTEWANHTRTVNVKAVTPPSLQSGAEYINVTLKAGDTNTRLVCDAVGDPHPVVTWSNVVVPGVRVNGPVMTFTRVSAWLNDLVIRCKATNKYGDSVSKAFEINVTGVEEEMEPPPVVEPPVVSTTTIVIIIVVLTCAILLAAGLVFLYRKYRLLGSVIAAYLSSDEVQEFREGKKVAAEAGNHEKEYADAPDPNPINIDYFPYNSEYEVARENFVIDLDAELGAGEYGIVYRGSIKRAGQSQGQNSVAVAVKTVRKNVHINYFKALLSELKILAHIGNHEHIVALVGAYSANIKNRELYVGIELCKTSLLRYLRQNRANFKNFVQPNTGELGKECSSVMGADYQNESSIPVETLSTFDLIRWAGDIASGMEFLSTKRIVHGDLAARNILLSFDMHAKICDFGLARQLIDYNYIKSVQCPLPWKWMAIESLAQMQFSTYSDAWAYGVTLWELFSLGNVPYPGMAWNADFIGQLHGGLRMTRPLYASNTIFDMMLLCWHDHPRDRPRFSTLKEFFQSLDR